MSDSWLVVYAVTAAIVGGTIQYARGELPLNLPGQGGLSERSGLPGLSGRPPAAATPAPTGGAPLRSLSSAHRIEGIDVDGWHSRAVHNRRQINRMRHILLTDPNVDEAINLAATIYGNGPTLWRKARCETGGTLNPRSHNRRSSASGLFQFLPSTWAATPFGGFSVWSPYANALAAGWMHHVGRGSEWTCR